MSASSRLNVIPLTLALFEANTCTTPRHHVSDFDAQPASGTSETASTYTVGKEVQGEIHVIDLRNEAARVVS